MTKVARIFVFQFIIRKRFHSANVSALLPEVTVDRSEALRTARQMEIQDFFGLRHHSTLSLLLVAFQAHRPRMQCLGES